MHIECIAVNDVLSDLARLFYAVGVQFDAVSDGLWIPSYCVEGAAVTDARIQNRAPRDGKLQETSNPFSLR